MVKSWTIGKKIAAGFGAMVLIATLIALMAVYQLTSVVAARNHFISTNVQALIEMAKLKITSEREVAAFRAALFTREERFLSTMRQMRSELAANFETVRAQLSDREDQQSLTNLLRLELEHQAAMDALLAKRETLSTLESVLRVFDAEITPKRDAVEQAVTAFVAAKVKVVEDAKRELSEANSRAATILIVLAGLGVLVALASATWLVRNITREIGQAIASIQSSSSELQAAANQQATGSKEQATATNQITSTIRELLATSRQISESAQRVSRIAEDTMSAARLGDQTVQKAQEAIGAIKRQVDFIVSHMLNLGKKSQQIGGILEIINELAEQTNILAINATIESAGAGEAGKRFSVVAEEIRKLADRVGGSTKEIRTLIDEIRSAANSSVMATEDGTKAVDSGARQFTEVAAAFTKIVAMIGTTSEASREIELSTKQQTTAVEQVNVAIADVAQAAKESEASTRQTLQTSSELAALSRNLGSLIEPRALA